MPDHPVAAMVVLAAGEGTRMRSALPKPLHVIAGRSLLGHVLAAAEPLAAEHTAVVVGHGRERVTEHVAAIAPSARTVVQDSQDGTGHAVRIALAGLPPLSGTVVVAPGDTPLLTASTLEALVAHRAATGQAATLLTAVVPDPTGYGRVVRDGQQVAAIVEHRDADLQARSIAEVNAGVYAFDAARLAAVLDRLGTANAAGEEYLTDVVALLVGAGEPVGAVLAADAGEVLGVNDRVQLAQVRRALNDRLLERWMRAGVTVVDPATTWVDVQVVLEPDVTLHPDVQLHGATVVRRGAVIGPRSTLTDCLVESGAHVLCTWGTGARVGPDAEVGPYTYLRPGTRLGPHSKAGAYVEIKASSVGAGSKVPHLSYVGDAEIGERSNIGAATVFVNYDGVHKHPTRVGDDVRVGSDTMLVAPVSVGDGAYTAAGSVITQDVPPGALALGRARQRTIPGWVRRARPGSAAAAAAERAAARGDATQDSPAGDGPTGSADER